MAIAVVQSATATSGSYVNTSTIALTGVTAGNFLILAFRGAAVNGLSSVTDSAGSTWTKLTSHIGGSSASLDIWYTANVSSGTHTLTLPTTTYMIPSAVIREYSGVALTSPIDTFANHSEASYYTAHTVGPSSATTAANACIFVAYAGDSHGGTYTAGSGFGNLSYITSGLEYSSVAVEDKLVTATGTQSGSITSSISQNGAVTLVVIKDVNQPAPPANDTKFFRFF